MRILHSCLPRPESSTKRVYPDCIRCGINNRFTTDDPRGTRPRLSCRASISVSRARLRFCDSFIATFIYPPSWTKSILSPNSPKFTNTGKPYIAGELNGQLVKLGKLKGEFVWHRHEDEDE